MKNIETIHEEAFAFLTNWSENMRVNENEINPYFYLRNVYDDRLKNGYWFPGDDENIYISFWAGGDSIKKTPNVYFEINLNQGCSLIFSASDSESKYLYFKNLAEFSLFRNPKSSHNILQTQSNTSINFLYSFESDKWLTLLKTFMSFDKPIIDEYVKNNPYTAKEEFISYFGFIEPSNFNEMHSRILKERNQRIKTIKHQELLSAPKLPFAIHAINIENFQGIKIASIADLQLNAQWIYITGENGYGKTTLLQAIALGLNNDPALENYFDSNTRISIELIHNNEFNIFAKTKGSINVNEKNNFSEFVIGYGPVRLNIQSKSSENMEDKSKNSVLSLFDNEALLKNINYELFASNHSDMTTFRELEELINVVTKGRISNIDIHDREARFIETLSNGDKLDPIPLSKLAAGFRSIINIIVDIYLRFKKIHVNKKYTDFYGIVLIDEIENHLHPILQRELPLTLSKVFPNIQFIISTHSPIPLLAAQNNSVILKVNRTLIEGVSIERLDESIDFPNLLPNTILTSPIFGFQGIFSESKDNSEFLRVETTYSEIKENDNQADRIAKHLSGKTTNEILKLLKK